MSLLTSTSWSVDLGAVQTDLALKVTAIRLEQEGVTVQTSANAVTFDLPAMPRWKISSRSGALMTLTSGRIVINQCDGRTQATVQIEYGRNAFSLAIALPLAWLVTRSWRLALLLGGGVLVIDVLIAAWRVRRFFNRVCRPGPY